MDAGPEGRSSRCRRQPRTHACTRLPYQPAGPLPHLLDEKTEVQIQQHREAEGRELRDAPWAPAVALPREPRVGLWNILSAPLCLSLSRHHSGDLRGETPVKGLRWHTASWTEGWRSLVLSCVATVHGQEPCEAVAPPPPPGPAWTRPRSRWHWPSSKHCLFIVVAEAET